jgi:uncharacterized membrane protein YoaK (UPF0700 family)
VNAASKPEAAAAAAAPSARVITTIAVLLTFASGSTDVAALTRLGNAFASVMTGNMIVFGLSLARQSVSLGAHTVTAVAGYIVGVAAGTVIGREREKRASGTAAGNPGAGKPAAGNPADGVWPAGMALTLTVELVLFAGVLAGWELSGSQPAGAAQYVLLATAACGMGLQAEGVNRMRLGHVRTTYLTGTLTGLISSIFRPEDKVGLRSPAVLAGLVTGAVLAGLLLAAADWAVPCLPVLGVTAALVLGTSRSRIRGR